MANVEFRERLRNGEVALGIITHLDSIDLVEITGLVGWDYVLLDREHGAIGDERLTAMIRAAHGIGLPAAVRVLDDHPKSILRVCDLGADAVMVPQIESGEQARRAVQAMRYPPNGDRGLHSGTPGARWGAIPLQHHVRIQDEGIGAWLQIETAAGVEKAEEIMASELDAVIVGPGDLSQSLGVTGGLNNPEVRAATERVFDIAREAGMRYGSVSASEEQARYLAEQGATVILIGLLDVVKSGLQGELAMQRTAFSRVS
jgi:4-hydroxy-2-oxoheptanedioate aldolase